MFVWLLPIALCHPWPARGLASLARTHLARALLAAAIVINSFLVPSAVLMLLAAILFSLGQPS
jgi:hypothetical protein